jgi:hypothetical protein
VQGNKDPIIIGTVKSMLTHSILAKSDIKTPEQLKGKRIGVSRIAATRTILLSKHCVITDWIAVT